MVAVKTGFRTRAARDLTTRREGREVEVIARVGSCWSDGRLTELPEPDLDPMPINACGLKVCNIIAALIVALVFWTAIIIPNFELILSYAKAVKTSPGLRGAD